MGDDAAASWDQKAKLPPRGATEAKSGKVAAPIPAGAQGVSPGNFLLLFSQLLFLVFVIYRFHLESPSFLQLSLITVAGFAVHYFLPFRLRLPFFTLLSLIAIVRILGLEQGAWLIGLGFVLIGLAHLPVPMKARAAIMIGVGVALSLLRFTHRPVPWSGAVWPILGSMFVFRMINYLYDLSHKAGPTRKSQTLAYFFLLPNICFPLFPVVDFTKFCRNYYDHDRHRIYQVGVSWIWRGLLQLVLYRLVYYHLTVDALGVYNAADFALYALSTFLLYVRISGQFHIIIGILHLFGFSLPESHHRYFFAASFTDFWRRINIYWKDFMMKIFYYPAYFKVRALGETKALVIATLFTFLCTWALHAVQWFWIRGSVYLESNDAAFWTIFALLVLFNSIYESRRGRTRSLAKRARTIGESVGLVLRTVGVFLAICILWSLWSAESIGDWLLLCASAAHLPDWPAWKPALLFGSILLAGLVAVYGVWKGWNSGPERFSQRRDATAVLAGAAILLLSSTPIVTGAMGSRGEILESLRATHLSRRDAEEFQRGYYENLLAVNKFNNELNRIYEKLPGDFGRSLGSVGLAHETGDYQDYELVPLSEGRFHGVPVRVNRWGMRDQDYTQARPAGVYRMAFLGASFTMGSSVEADSMFEKLTEDHLNQEATSSGAPKYELLNFAIAGYSPLHILYQFEHKVLGFDPNLVIYFGHSNDLDHAQRQCTRMVLKEVETPYPAVRELVARAGIRPGMGSHESTRRMRPHDSELLTLIYARIVSDCRERGIVPIFAYLPGVTESAETWRARDRVRVLQAAHDAGFTVLDLTGVFDGQDPSRLWITENDQHPNALGNRLIAERLCGILEARRGEFGLDTPPPASMAQLGR
ncbi:MAG: SGNH/GDSL hydrolase family protein [Candidatus Eisenbacteria bacterium]